MAKNKRPTKYMNVIAIDEFSEGGLIWCGEACDSRWMKEGGRVRRETWMHVQDIGDG